MENNEILGRVHRLVDEEHTLRARMAQGAIDGAEERQRLEDVESELDQCWDLLRRRRAAIDAGTDPSSTEVRSAREVRNYLQ
ncbi:MAG: DUF2630 family protein [Acidothermales bacterium]|nr:DUF2630 family protein [Acidothermales bacterium]